MPHAGTGRAQKRSGSTQRGRSLTRRASVVFAVTLAAMALTTADGPAFKTPTSTSHAAAPATPSATPAPAPTAVSAIEASAEVATVVQAASQALSEAEYVTTEAPVDTAARDQITKASSALVTLVQEARTKPVALEHTGTTTRGGVRPPLEEAATTAADAAGAGATPAAEPVAEKTAAPDSGTATDTGTTTDTGKATDTGKDPSTTSATDQPDPAPEVVALTVPDEPGEPPAQVLGTATTAPEATGPTSDTEQTADEAAVAIQEATDALNALLDTTQVATVSVTPPPPTPEEIAAQQAAEAAARAAAEAARLSALAAPAAGYANGRIPTRLLCGLSFAPGQRLRCDAADQLERLNTAFREAFGRNLSVSDSYRSYSAQVAVKAIKSDLAAPPGTSNHGLGLAVDLADGMTSYSTAQYEWMRANGPAFGWDNPEWARRGGDKSEPWHWEYGTQA